MLMNMAKVLEVANEHNFAVPAFNVSMDAMLNGVMESCEEEKSPVILAIHPNELAYEGDSFVEMVKYWANKTVLPVAIHLDHGATLEQVQRALRDGFTSVMIDASSLPFDENIDITKKVIAIAHPQGVSVEAELGTIGTADDADKGGTANIRYTDPSDAVKFVAATGCDCLAVAIGTAHGIYPKGFDPHLKLDLLEQIKSQVSIPLVLHGGSGNPDSEISEAVTKGINKVNISSDIKHSFFVECREVLKDQHVREPMDVFPSCVEAMKKTAVHKIRLFHSDGKLKYYYQNL
jgi:fructose-bisphosphate aldolase class II